MATIVTSITNSDTQAGVAYETFSANFNDQTALTITPTYIKAITAVTATPTNATAAASAGFYLNGFAVGAATAVFAGTNNETYLITVYGSIA